MAANEMIAKLFAARTMAHMNHLQTPSFATHKALDEFYNEIIEVADTFAETYQGFFGIIRDYPDVGFPTGKPMNWINELREWLKANRDSNCRGETVLENINDEIMGLCAQIVYKLKFFDNPEQTTPIDSETGRGPKCDNDNDEDDMMLPKPKGDYMKMSTWK